MLTLGIVLRITVVTSIKGNQQTPSDNGFFANHHVQASNPTIFAGIPRSNSLKARGAEMFIIGQIIPMMPVVSNSKMTETATSFHPETPDVKRGFQFGNENFLS